MTTRAASSHEGEVRPSFEQEWPELARQLERFLAAKGVDRWLRADVIQETAARLYPRWERLDHSLPLWNLTATIAMRLVHNHRRKESRIELVPDPVPIHNDDVHLRGLQRAQLDKTRTALRGLSADQRRVLLAEIGEAAVPLGTRNRINVLRLRARAKLREAVGPWAPSAIPLRLRHLRARVSQKRAALQMHTPAMANSLVNVSMAVALGLVGGPSTAVDAPSPVTTERPPSLSLAQLQDVQRDPAATIRRSLPSNHSSEGSGLITDRPTTAERPGTWAGRRQEEVGNLAEDGRRLAEDGARLAGDGARLAEDGAHLAEDGAHLAEDGRDVAEEWARGRQKEVGDRKKEVGCLVSQEDC